MRHRWGLLGTGVLLIVSVASNWTARVAPTVQAAPSATLTIYDDTLINGWQDWSWDPITLNLSNSSPVHSGSHSIAVTFTGGWGGLQFGHQPAVDLSGYDTLRFWIHGGSGGQSVTVHFGGDSVVVTPQANQWKQVDIPFSQLGYPATTDVVVFWNNTGNAQAKFYLDDIQLVNTGLPTPVPTKTPTPVPAGLGPALSVNAQADVHPISPDIYGMNFADEALADELDLPVRRWGGNSTSRYNWQSNLSNTGNDWYFENIPQDGSASANGSATDLFVEQDRRTGTKTIMTVPLIGWVAKSSSPRDHPYACGFKVSKYGPQIVPPDRPWLAAVDPWDTDCGSGVKASGDITGNDPLDTSTAISPTFVTNWINHLISRYGTAANGGVKFYNLDNEPMLWNSTHRDVHPQPTSYDEMITKTYAYAAAIKAADPSAQTLGPVEWGWCGYFYSQVDGCQIGTDYTSHNNTPFVEWYLQQMHAYEQSHSVRILDYLDEHFYPQANGVSLSPAGNAATQALRLRSTRSLWDSTYIDESWISDGGGVAVNFIPRMKAWVNANYPGTKLAITEYNWGALDHINGAVAQADVLGIFGREGLDLATLWGPPSSTEPGAFAFRMYRNYDGTHRGLGETSVRATSADQGQLAIYAAKRGSDNALTLIVINKSLTQPLTSTVTISGYVPFVAAPMYRYSAANLNAIVRGADQPIGPGTGDSDAAFTTVFPAASITLFELRPNVPLDQHVYLPVILKQ